MRGDVGMKILDPKRKKDLSREYIGFGAPKGFRDSIKEAAQIEGVSLQAYIRLAIEERIERTKKGGQ